MKTYIRLLSYLKEYKVRFMLGVVAAFLAAIFNGLSMMSLKPIFEVLGASDNRPFQLSLTQEEIQLLFRNNQEYRLKNLLVKAKDYPGLLAKESIHYNKLEKEKNVIKKNKTFSFVENIKSYFVEKIIYLNEIFIKYKALQFLSFVVIFIIPIYLFRLIFNLLTVYFIASSGLAAVKDIRRNLYNKLILLPLGNFVREKTGVWMSRIINDVSLVSDSISNDFRISITNFFIIITHLLILLVISYKLLLLCFIGVPLVLWPVSYFAKRVKNVTTNEQVRLADLNGHLQEMIAGIRVIRAFGMEGYEKKRFGGINNDLYTQTLKYRVNHTIGPALVEMVTSFIIIGLLLYGGHKIVDGELSSGSFFTFLFTLIVILSPIKQMASWVNIVHRSTAAGERIFEISDMDSEIQEKKDAKILKDIKKEIEFRDVSFTYPETDAEVLKNINIKVPVGSTLAIVGASGGGKSTLVDLIPRFYDILKGKLLVDGVNIQDLSIKSFREKIGVVTQEIFLFNGSIRDNLNYGREDIEEDAMIEAAKLAFAHDFIKDLPEKYDTIIGERGLLLSGGQRQRLSIARALLKDPEILILDEATSALDTQSERLVQQALETLMKNRTTFVIAHRLSTIYQADNIIVINEGRIVEEGNHKNLLKLNKAYKHLYDMQFNKT